MAPPKKKQAKKKKEEAQPKKSSLAEKLTLEELDAISSDDDDSGPDDEATEWDAEAQALRQAIAEGAFDRLLQQKANNKNDEQDEMEEASLHDESDASLHDDDDEEEDENEEEDEKEKPDEEEDDVHQEEEDSDDESSTEPASGDAKPKFKNNEVSHKALITTTEDLIAAKRDMPWVETFDIVPLTPLPFGIKSGTSDNNDSVVDVHDDLKRELTFYNMALEAVGEAKIKCKKFGVPFSRPEDFFAEMVKTDDHMAKVKDRLIFETKKMEAVAQRKSNKEQKLRVREVHENKLADKVKRKKEHERAVEDWAKKSSQSDFGGNNSSRDEKRGGGGGPNKKRLAADRKFGFGGKRGRFKQNDRNDDKSSFKPRGNFTGGKGVKRTRSSSQGASNRPGKRTRDAGRARRST